MKATSLNLFLCLPFFLLFFKNSNGQTTYGDSLSIQAEATIVANPASITITWPADADATNFIIYRKLKTAASWGSILATLPANSSQYSDATVSSGILYDYKIQMNSPSTLIKYGYLSSGVDVKAYSNRGIAIVVIENSFNSNTTYQAAIDLFLGDLENDGWFPKTIYVNKTDLVPSVKSQIVMKYNEEATRTKLLVLFGNVPVPYAGDLNPDGHTDHQGAWPTDTYYADMDGVWNDIDVNNVTSANLLNRNIPGDGKFDESNIPSNLELQVGRVDLSDLPAFSSSEENLLIKYLNKLHRFKTAQLVVQQKALIDDEFTSYAEGFSQNGYKNFSALVGRNNIAKADYFSQLSYNTSSSGTYLWSYGCGAGNYTSASGIGSSSNFASDSLSSVFTMLFGSYFGDWNYSNAFLRSALASGNTLTNAWAGRPNCFYQHMAMGENIGYSTLLTQNNAGLYLGNSLYGFVNRLVSVNLMGEPSLRNNYILAPLNLTISSTGVSNTLNWNAGGSEIGYNIYRRYSDSTNFFKLNSDIITATNYTDNALTIPGTVYYYVKAVEKRVSPSGTYDNESLGLRTAGAAVTVGVNENATAFISEVYPNPFTNSITISGNNILKLEILSYNGAIIQTSNYASINTIELSLIDLSKGIYFINIFSSNGTIEHQKILKVK